VANLKHVDILKQGTDVWNKWRDKNTDIQRPDFIEAHLERANLTGAIFSWDTKITIDQLYTVKTLYGVVGLDSTLLKQIQKNYPHLMKEQ
jgi:hypothetical protein